GRDLAAVSDGQARRLDARRFATTFDRLEHARLEWEASEAISAAAGALASARAARKLRGRAGVLQARAQPLQPDRQLHGLGRPIDSEPARRLHGGVAATEGRSGAVATAWASHSDAKPNDIHGARRYLRDWAVGDWTSRHRPSGRSGVTNVNRMTTNSTSCETYVSKHCKPLPHSGQWTSSTLRSQAYPTE
ncbi:unnamed protein product, partial [Prorocentrum cordatum]